MHQDDRVRYPFLEYPNPFDAKQRTQRLSAQHRKSAKESAKTNIHEDEPSTPLACTSPNEDDQKYYHYGSVDDEWSSC